MDTPPLRRHPLVIGTIAAVVALVVAAGAAAAWTAFDDGPADPTVDATLRFLPRDNERDDENGGNQPLIAPDRTGQPAPTDTFLTLSGKPSSLADYRGTPLIVNFFGSWCGPCRRETPAIEALHQELGSKVRFLGLAIRDSQRSARAFVEEMGVTYDVGRDPSDRLLIAFGAVTAPSTFVVSSDGRIVGRHLGEASAGQLRKLLRDEVGVS